MSRTRTTATLLIALLTGATALTSCGGTYNLDPSAAAAGATGADEPAEAAEAAGAETPADDAAEAPSAGGYGNPTPTTAPRTTAPKAKAPSAGGAGGAAKTATLTVSNFAFGAPLTVSPGTSVSVRNRDSAPHTVTGSGFDTGTVGGGATGTFKAPNTPGTHRFSCQIHPSMTGSLTVR